MAIKVKFFASLREQMPESLGQIEAEGVTTISDVWQRATANADMPPNVLSSINLVHCETSAIVSDGDEVAFFPPVTGG